MPCQRRADGRPGPSARRQTMAWRYIQLTSRASMTPAFRQRPRAPKAARPTALRLPRAQQTRCPLPKQRPWRQAARRLFRAASERRRPRHGPRPSRTLNRTTVRCGGAWCPDVVPRRAAARPVGSLSLCVPVLILHLHPAHRARCPLFLSQRAPSLTSSRRAPRTTRARTNLSCVQLTSSSGSTASAAPALKRPIPASIRATGRGGRQRL